MVRVSGDITLVKPPRVIKPPYISGLLRYRGVLLSADFGKQRRRGEEKRVGGRQAAAAKPRTPRGLARQVEEVTDTLKYRKIFFAPAARRLRCAITMMLAITQRTELRPRVDLRSVRTQAQI